MSSCPHSPLHTTSTNRGLLSRGLGIDLRLPCAVERHVKSWFHCRDFHWAGCSDDAGQVMGHLVGRLPVQ